MTVHQARALLAESRQRAEARDWPGALEPARRSVDRARSAGDPAVLGAALTNLAICLSANRASEPSRAAAQEAADIFRRLQAQDPDAHQDEAASALAVLSDALEDEDPERALTVLQDALELRRRLYQGDPTLATGLDLLGSLGKMDDRLMDVDRPDLQAGIDDERRWLLRALAGAGPEATDDRVVGILARMAADLLRTGSSGRGEDLAELVLDVVDDDRDDDDDDDDDDQGGRGVALGTPAGAEIAAMSLARARARAATDPTSGEAFCRDAVDRYRDLDRESPGRYRADLVAALELQVELLAAAGHRLRSRTVGREARKLAGGGR